MLQETRLHFPKDGNEFYSMTAGGEVLNTYRRTRPTTIYTLRAHGDISEAMYAAGTRYRHLYEASGYGPRYSGGDPSNPKVDGSGAAPDELRGSDTAKEVLNAIRASITDRGADLLDRICGQDMTITEYRFVARKRWQAVRREIRMYLDRLDDWFRAVQSRQK